MRLRRLAGAALCALLLPVLPAAQASAASSGYRLTTTRQSNGARVVVRWNPCRTITYRVNVSAVPAARRAAMSAEVRAAVARVASATGMRFSYRGTTRQVPQSRLPAAPAADLIVAVTRASRTDLAIGGSTVGIGGTGWTTWERRSGSSRSYVTAVTHGFVAMDYSAFSGLRSGFGAGPSQGNALLHELGHAVGLRHATSSAQVMYPYLGAGTPKGFASGDRTGLRKVGRSAGCIAVP